MKLLWLTWKDADHPLAGGAEIVHDELAKRLAADGHEVVFVVPSFPGGAPAEKKNGYTVRRVGNRLTVYWEAYRLYKKEFQGWPDVVIDSYFVLPFFAKFYAKGRCVLFVHNLCRVIWFYQMWFPASLIGWLLEPLYLRLVSGMEAVAVSESTKNDLIRYGFRPERIHIIGEGIEIEPVLSLDAVEKFEKPTILSLGALRSMKRTGDIVKAFEILKKKMPDIELVVAGKPEDAYGRRVVRMMMESPHASSIHYLGKVSKEQKIELMRKAHLIAVTSVKEGWGLIVTEANSQGTPAVVYDMDGLRDSVKNGTTGWISKSNSPKGLAGIVAVSLSDLAVYREVRMNAWKFSRNINFENSFKDLVSYL